jgi:hypothetical protein
MSTSTIAVEHIHIDPNAQMRITTSETVVADYSEALSDGAKFPPIVVFFDGKKYWLADGFHRHAAHVKLGLETILANVCDGGQRDAIHYSLGANETHGLRRTRADKRRAVSTALADPEWVKLSDRDVAKMCGVSHTLVSQVRSGPVVLQMRAQTERTTGNIATTTAGQAAADIIGDLVELAIADATTGNIATPTDGALLKSIQQLLKIASDDDIVDALSELNLVAKRRGII